MLEKGKVMNDEWLIYRSSTLQRLVAMPAGAYDKWAEKSTPNAIRDHPIIARGLTQQQAETMEEMTKEPE